MKPDEREELVERYISDSMSPMERHEFRIRLALDDELARMVRACGMADGLIDANRRDLMTDDSPLRSRVLALSMARPEAHAVGEAVSTERPGNIFSTFKAVLLSVAVIGSAGLFFLFDGDEERNEPARYAPAVPGMQSDTSTVGGTGGPLPSRNGTGVVEQIPAAPLSTPAQRKAARTDRGEERISPVEESSSLPTPAAQSATPAAAPSEDSQVAPSSRPPVRSQSVAIDTVPRSMNVKGVFKAPTKVK